MGHVYVATDISIQRKRAFSTNLTPSRLDLSEFPCVPKASNGPRALPTYAIAISSPHSLQAVWLHGGPTMQQEADKQMEPVQQR